MKNEKEVKQPKKNPLELFFSLGEKVTKTPEQKALFDYIFLWIIFLAFFTILIGNLYNFFFVEQSITYLGWSAVMVGILWFQYNGLKQYYGMRKMMMEMKKNPPKKEEMKVESFDEMLKSFKDAKPK